MGMFILRLTAGSIYTIYGCQKVFGVFGGLNLAGVASFLSERSIPAPYLFAYLLGLSELIGGLGVLIGLKIRWCALILSIITLLAIVTVHVHQGSFIVDKGGFACPFPLLAICLALFFFTFNREHI